jgi:hypothetical protein
VRATQTGLCYSLETAIPNILSKIRLLLYFIGKLKKGKKVTDLLVALRKCYLDTQPRLEDKNSTPTQPFDLPEFQSTHQNLRLAFPTHHSYASSVLVISILYLVCDVLQ